MTEMNGPLKEVAALVEERRRYETWLAALDARRDSTPAHVFERVQADYRSRMQTVEQRIASHRKAIEDERASVQSRLSLLDAEERMRRDERAELELRTHVGELDGADATAAFEAVDGAVEQLGGERRELTERVTQLDVLLEIKPEAVADEPASDSPDAPDAPAPDLARPQTPGGSFDELAFLDTVVGKEGGPDQPEPAAEHESLSLGNEPDAESLLAGLQTKPRGEPDGPLAANVPANTPIVLRTSGSIEQSKTLKCSECGAMNYPTEWYCERCGAELAAL